MYLLKLKTRADRQLQGLAVYSAILYQEALNIILDLRGDPRPSDALEMVDDYDGFYRIRFNNHRIIYRIDDTEKTVTIWAIKPRTPSTYRDLF